MAIWGVHGSTQLLEFDDEQHLHPSHTSNGSYTTLRTGTYSSGDCRLLVPELLAPAACSRMFAGAPSQGLPGIRTESRTCMVRGWTASNN